MKIQQTPKLQLNSRQQNKNEKTNPSFKGGEGFVQLLNFLETNQAWGATAVDIGCMGVPRSMTDFTRGPEAGLETMRREFSSTLVDALIGAYGLGVAFLLAQGFNKDFGVKAHKMFISDEMLEISETEFNKNSKNSAEPIKEFLTRIAQKTKGFNPELESSTGWVELDSKTQADFVEKMEKAVIDEPKNLTKETKAYLRNILADATGAEKHFKIEGEGSKKAVSNLDAYIDDVYKITKAFATGNKEKLFKDGKLIEDGLIHRLKNLNKTTSIIGIAIAAALGCSLQPINMYLTRKKTGKSGFVGVEGKEPDKSKGFKLLKLAAAGLAGFAVLRTIGKNSSEVLSQIKFKGFFPTIPQYKFVYGFTIVSRLLSARDKNELRESSIKDSLGFANWLILGGFVSKLTAAGFEKMSQFKKGDFIRHSEAEYGKGFWKWLTEAPLVSRAEVLHSEFKKLGRSTIKDGKALTFKEMMKKAATIPEMKKATNRVKYLGLIQFAGYLYSGIVLGVGIPKLNIAITKSVEKKRKAKLEAAKTTQQTVEPNKIETQTAVKA